jgi:alkyldihydroxyacetonephosphate synthase
MAIAGWGDPARRHGLPSHAATWLRREIGPTTPALPVEIRLAPGRLAPQDREALVTAVGTDGVRTDDAARVRHAAGRSYLDLIALRSGDVEAPDAVVLPGSAAEVAAVLTACAQRRIAVVPFGGGTSVVGGVSPDRGDFDAVVAVDLQRMDRLLSVDEEALTATFEPGVRGPAAEALLNAQGLTLGHFPQSYEYASLGGYAATRSSGQASTGYGRFD